MTATSSVTHPNGVKFTYVIPGNVIYVQGGWFRSKGKGEQYGVVITYPCGTKRFIGNSWYD